MSKRSNVLSLFMHAFREGAVGGLVFGGCATALVCGVGSWFLTVGFGVSGARFGASDERINTFLIAGMVVAGVALVAAAVGVVWGLILAKSEHKGKPMAIPEAKVMARYAIDDSQTMITDEVVITHLDRPRFYVRLDTGSKENLEYQCAEPVFWQAGEGMKGKAIVQGKWLSSFEPFFGANQGRQDDRVPSIIRTDDRSR